MSSSGDKLVLFSQVSWINEQYIDGRHEILKEPSLSALAFIINYVEEFDAA